MKKKFGKLEGANRELGALKKMLEADKTNADLFYKLGRMGVDFDGGWRAMWDFQVGLSKKSVDDMNELNALLTGISDETLQNQLRKILLLTEPKGKFEKTVFGKKVSDVQIKALKDLEAIQADYVKRLDQAYEAVKKTLKTK
jgi:hypothetical protein